MPRLKQESGKILTNITERDEFTEAETMTDKNNKTEERKSNSDDSSGSSSSDDDESSIDMDGEDEDKIYAIL